MKSLAIVVAAVMLTFSVARAQDAQQADPNAANTGAVQNTDGGDMTGSPLPGGQSDMQRLPDNQNPYPDQNNMNPPPAPDAGATGAGGNMPVDQN